MSLQVAASIIALLIRCNIKTLYTQFQILLFHHSNIGHPCSDLMDLNIETLEKQYELVRRRTSNNYTYNQGSHVMQYGSLVIDEEPAADYLGFLNTGAPS